MVRTLVAPLAALAFVAAAPVSASASDFDGALTELAVNELRAHLSDPALIAAIKAQNEANGGLSEADIDALDQQWRAQVGASDAALIDGVLGAAVSATLADIRDASEGLFTEIFVMDKVGLNVAASDVTSDYWQGDEAKWRETFLVGADAVHLGEVELDESTQTYQAQVSLSIADPETGAPIGAATFGVNVEFLE